MNSKEKIGKLIETTKEFLQYSLENIDYVSISKNILDLTNVKYVVFNLFQEDSGNYKKMAEVGDENYAIKFPKSEVVKILAKDQLLGSFDLFSDPMENFRGRDLLELYIQQIGLLFKRLKSDRSLRENEDRFKSYMDNSPYGIFIVDGNTERMIDANKMATDISGYTYEELMKMLFKDLVIEAKKEIFTEHIRKVFSLGKEQIELELIKKNKKKIIVEITGIRLTNTSAIGFLKDITKKKIIDEELRHMNLMKNSLLDSTIQMFLLLDKNFLIIDYNKTAEFMSKELFKVELYKGISAEIFVPEENKKLFIEKYTEALAGKSDKNEIVLRDPQGRDLYFELSLNPIIDEDSGEVWAVSLSGYNITGLKVTEKALRKSEERFRMAAMSTSDLIYELDLETDQVTWFGDYQKFASFGLSFHPKTFSDWTSCIHPDDQDRITRLSKKDGTTRKPYSGEYRLVDKDGNTIYIEDYALGTYDENNILRKIVGAITNISSRKYYEEQLKFLSFFDQLTEVNNRGYFEEKLKELTGKNNPVSIIVIDLDGLKLINDTMGHFSGDNQLKNTARIVKEAVRTKDLVSRIGGDEFAVILPNTGAKEAEKIMDLINHNIDAYNQTDKIIPISISCGLATSKPGMRLEEVFKRADDYMYRNKLSKGNSAKSQIIDSLMATLAERDYITEGHANRLSDICMKMGMKLNLTYQELNNLNLLAKVHDLGKVGIPDNILFKPSALNAAEWEIMKLHPEKGFRIAIAAPDLTGIADLILKHHERWDGTGYPIALKGKEIPLECRILSVADTFDAIINDRPYSKARSKEEALAEIIRCSGTQFDPEVVEVFLKII